MTLLAVSILVVGCTSASDTPTDDPSTTAPPDTTTTTTSTRPGGTTTTVTTATAVTTTTATEPTTTTTVAPPPDNQAPVVTITSPAHLSRHAASYDPGSGMFGAPVTLTAQVTDPDGDPVTVRWSSSDEGSLGTGESISVTLHTVGSDSSQPFITATAVDRWGAETSDSVQVIISVPSDT